LEDEDLFAQRDLSNDLNNQIAHYFATDLYTPSEVLPLIDPAQDYKYTVQLIAEHSKFEGSFMEVTSKSLRYTPELFHGWEASNPFLAVVIVSRSPNPFLSGS